MDISFDIKNSKGDHIMVALSYYDKKSISVFTDDPETLTLFFYDVTLVRKSGEGYVGYKTLFAISDILARFMRSNENAVLCFYCDPNSPVRRNHGNLLPQAYRSQLFSRMFDLYMRSGNSDGFVNHCVRICDSDDPKNSQFAHFICRSEHKGLVLALEKQLMDK